jgi:hypothetical protein
LALSSAGSRRDEGRLAAVDAPRLVKAAEVKRIEAARVADRGRIVIGSGSSRGSTEMGMLPSVDDR